LLAIAISLAVSVQATIYNIVADPANPFAFAADDLKPPVPYDPNPGVVVNAAIDVAADIDTYSATFPLPTTVMIWSNSSLDLIGQLLDSNSVLVTSNNNARPNTQDFFMQANIPAGVFTIQVSNVNPLSTGAYSLTVITTSTDDYGDTFALPFSLNSQLTTQTIDGFSWGGSDIEMFNFTAAASGTLFWSASSENPFIISLYSSAEAYIGDADAGSVTAGLSYFIVATNPYSSPGPFRFTISFPCPATRCTDLLGLPYRPNQPLFYTATLPNTATIDFVQVTASGTPSSVIIVNATGPITFRVVSNKRADTCQTSGQNIACIINAVNGEALGMFIQAQSGVVTYNITASNNNDEDYGNTLNIAFPVTMSPQRTIVSGSIDYQNDVDVFVFVPLLSQRARISAIGAIQLRGTLLAADGSTLVTSAVSDSLLVEFDVTVGTTYYFQISGSTTRAVGSYGISFQLVQLPQPGREPVLVTPVAKTLPMTQGDAGAAAQMDGNLLALTLTLAGLGSLFAGSFAAMMLTRMKRKVSAPEKKEVTGTTVKSLLSTSINDD
jgi:hypothetical protein